MEIIDERGKEIHFTFFGLDIGDVFEFKNKFYIKVDVSTEMKNAFSLSDMCFSEFFEEDKVHPVNAKLVIGD